MRRELAEVAGNAPGQASTTGGRVKAVIQPPPPKKEAGAKAEPTLELKSDGGKP
jgi:hypothetical protein